MADSWWSAPRTWRDVVLCVVGLHKCTSDYGDIQRCTCGAFGPWPWFHLSRSEKREKWRTRERRTETCGTGLAWCRCIEPTGHDGAHRCDCDGSWAYGDAGDLQILEFPNTDRSALLAGEG